MMSEQDHDEHEEDGLLPRIGRRGFLAGTAAATLGAGLGFDGAEAMPDTANRDAPPSDDERLAEAFRLRKEAARDLLDADVGDKAAPERYEKKHGSFTKALPHNEFGEVDLSAYEKLDEALETRDVEAYNDIPLGKGRGLANPIASRAFNLTGADGHEKTMPDFPALGSDEGAAEMVELYWRALLRDVPFEDYDDSELAQAAYDELADLDGYEGPTENGPYTDLFRSEYDGVRDGPFMSQFILQDCPFGAMTIENELRPQVKEDFMTDEASWLNVRRGAADVIRTEDFMDEKRRITNGRDLLTYVHRNIPSQSALNAAYMLLAMGVPMDKSIEGRDLETQNQFVEFGPPFVTTVVNGVVDNAKHGTWYNKWLAHRRARPEKYGGLVHFHKKSLEGAVPEDSEGGDEKEDSRGRGRGEGPPEQAGPPEDGAEDAEAGRGRYPFLNDDLLESEAVRQTKEEYGTWLLPQGYPEGSPTHPSYPAGHSVFIGASVTVLKALFDGDATLDRTITVDGDGEAEEINEELTVRGELNKLASNHAFGRDFAGIHYRTDGRDGHILGEEIALEYLRDEIAGTITDVGLTLTTFTGEEVTVTEDGIQR